MDAEPFVALPGIIVSEFQGQIRMIADALGVELDEIVQEFDRRPTDTPLDAAFGKVDAGTCGAIRMRAIGRTAGRNFITIEHVTRLCGDWRDVVRGGCDVGDRDAGGQRRAVCRRGPTGTAQLAGPAFDAAAGCARMTVS